jgi:hypothetical protein
MDIRANGSAPSRRALPRGCASFAATAEAHKATRVQKWRVLADCTIPPFDRRALFKVGMVEIGGAAGAGPYFVDRPAPPQPWPLDAFIERQGA